MRLDWYESGWWRCAVMVNMKNTSFEKDWNSLYIGVCPYIHGDG